MFLVAISLRMLMPRNQLNEIIERNKMKWDFIESVEFQGAPKEEELLIKVEAIIHKLIEKMIEKVVE